MSDQKPEQIQLAPASTSADPAPHITIASAFRVAGNLQVLHMEFCTTRLRVNGEDVEIEERAVVDVGMSLSLATELHEQLGEYLIALKAARLAKEEEGKE